MKKIISVILSVAMLCVALYIPLTVGAENLSTGETPAFDENYVAVFNDFESDDLRDFESSTTSGGASTFTVVDTGERDYEHSFRIAPVRWSSIFSGKVTDKSNTNVTYTDIKGATVNLFNEPLTEGNNYIMSYDYKNIATPSNSYQPVSLAPEHDTFKIINSAGGNDWYDYMTFYDTENWYKHIVGFTASKDQLRVKINSCTGAGAFLDNFLVVEAAEFKDSTQNTATVEVVDGEVVGSFDAAKNLVAKGTAFSIKVDTANPSYNIVVTHDGANVNPTDGVYTIDKVTGDIEVKTVINNESLTNLIANNFSVTNSDITFAPGDTLVTFTDKTKILDSMITLKDADGNSVRRDGILKAGYTLELAVDSGEPISYTVVIDGTVKDYSPTEEIKAVIDTYVNDTISNSSTGITADNLKNSLLNDGNRSAVANVIKKAMDGENVTIVTFGGSITAGAGSNTEPTLIEHSFPGNENYVKLVGDWFKSVFGDNVAVKNAGIGATDTPYAIHRMNMDVMAFSPDMVIVEWDKNDVNKDTYKQATYENMLRKFIEKGVAVVMFGMCGSNTNGDDSSIEMHIPLAEKYDLPYISYRDAFGDENDSYKSQLLKDLSADTVHPNIVGHHLVALLLNNYFGNIYKDIASIGSYEPAMPEKPYNAEATVFGEGKVVDLDDVAAGNVEGVRIKSFGSFEKDTTLYSPGAEDIKPNHKRYAYKAQYSQSYEPMVIEINNCYSLHLLLLRVNRTDGKFRVFVDDNEVIDPKGSFTSGSAKDNTQTESTFAWASSRVRLNNDPVNITLKILPTNKDPKSYVGLYGLLLADAPTNIDYSDGEATVTAPNALDLLSQGIVVNNGVQTTAMYLFARYDAPMCAGGKTANPNKIILDNGGVATVVSRTFYVMSKSKYDSLENKDDFGKVENLSGVLKNVLTTDTELAKYWRKDTISGTNNATVSFGVCIKNIKSTQKDSAFAVRAKVEYRIGDGEIKTVYSNIRTADYFSAQGAYDELKYYDKQPANWFNTECDDGGEDADNFFG